MAALSSITATGPMLAAFLLVLASLPVASPALIIVDPAAAAQVMQQPSMPKHHTTKDYIVPLTGPMNLATLEGAEWKKWRAVFNPGFSSAHLMSMAGEMIKDTLIFTEILSEHARNGTVFKLEEAATLLTVDIIGKMVLDMPLNAQTTRNELVSAFRNQLKWLPRPNDLNVFRRFNPLKPIMHRYNTRIMNSYLDRLLEDRFAARSQNGQAKNIKRSKPIIDLALDIYMNDIEERASQSNAEFKRVAIDQFKIFLFAGHDTTSSTLCYICHLLSQNPSALQKVRDEHDKAFGVDTSRTAQIISEDPHVLNKLSYSTAVIKEVLRLYPAASSVRDGDANTFVDFDGKRYPTDGFMLWAPTYAMHRRVELWPEPESFIPERFLVKEGDPLFPVKGAWRPFEYGPRNCIGQELAFIELKIIMALILRDFDIKAAYEEQDKLDGKNNDSMNWNGDRAYQVLIATAKPANRFPAKATRRSHTGSALGVS
ncbi:MAG: hypothetical protein Q9190_003660 [Brigantiaea leucoxantha]